MLYANIKNYSFIIIKRKYYKLNFFFFFNNNSCFKIKAKYIDYFYSQNNNIFINKYKKYNLFLYTIINQLFFNVKNKYIKYLFFKGIGYKLKIKKNNIYIIFGYNHILIFKILPYININVFKSKIIKIISLYKNFTNSMINKFVILKKFNIYKNTGICIKYK